jgi:rhodanese-related sulfurtransferase
VLLLLLALLPAALAGWLHPRSAFHAPAAIAGVEQVDPAAVRRWNATVLWVDARPAAAFAAAHVPGAVNLTERTWEQQLGDVVGRWQPAVRIVVYCDGAACQASTAVAKRLQRELQLERVYVLTGGWPAWQQADSR